MIEKLQRELDMLERHLEVLEFVVRKEPIGIGMLSNETGYPRHKVRYSLRVLEQDGLIEPSKRGAVTTDETEAFVRNLGEDVDRVVDRLTDMRILPESTA